MAKINLDTVAPPKRDTKLFSFTSPNLPEPLAFTLHRLGGIGGVNVVGFGKELNATWEAHPVSWGGEVIQASEDTCRMLATLVIAQVAEPDDVYDQEDLLKLAQFDDVLEFLLSAYEWAMSISKDDGGKKPRKARTRRSRSAAAS